METLNLLITGSHGQLGRELCDLLTAHPHINVTATDVEELDITNAEAVNAFFKEHSFHWVVNCAAYTAVDLAEDQADLCRKINVEGPQALAKAANTYGARMIHISTDYVFDGNTCTPYTEDHPTNPQSVYGITKLEGEKAVTDALPQQSVILRTAWLYSPHGKNFVKTMLYLGQTKQEIKVVNDQIGSPTYARDLAQAVIDIINAPTFTPGIFHFSNEGVISWYDFASAIMREAHLDQCRVLPCRSSEYPTRAKRPGYSVLSKEKIKCTYHIDIPYWLDSLQHCLQRLAYNDNRNL